MTPFKPRKPKPNPFRLRHPFESGKSFALVLFCILLALAWAGEVEYVGERQAECKAKDLTYNERADICE